MLRTDPSNHKSFSTFFPLSSKIYVSHSSPPIFDEGSANFNYFSPDFLTESPKVLTEIPSDIKLILQGCEKLSMPWPFHEMKQVKATFDDLKDDLNWFRGLMATVNGNFDKVIHNYLTFVYLYNFSKLMSHSYLAEAIKKYEKFLLYGSKQSKATSPSYQADLVRLDTV